ncbi:MAG: tRNA (cytidine(34)-2'-O)-methyltransferase [Eubacteriales bacterium]|jgi:tRNA (cytidine/uridine-2'-O-)-methyltransferase|nr:tRNA (cytidine(34)-2'-O)-methyltransferase [Eubacteriales bacterium]MDD4327609.1 tRNA (cytidine(34)-2'-O)-methyltransferase [Eubacteriales bacterium]MDD4717600.1 tRNA (cytidine(34)-2'-O)-methyltransferase [Eubacteriales bacterium]NCU25598.1 tRNA (cytidine(34)-2'-O)-methyltransferase [Candidatus Nomurabacteria bacterium]
MPAQIVLVEPEIPQNTGNIARTCVATGVKLHLIEPLGFSLSEKAVRRAGLDYWNDVDLKIWPSLDVFMDANKDTRMYMVSTKSSVHYASVVYPDDCMFIFGKETKGLPEQLLRDRSADCIRIPMLEEKRSLNLSNAAAIVLYEFLRQKGFPGLQTESSYFSV